MCVFSCCSPAVSGHGFDHRMMPGAPSLAWETGKGDDGAVHKVLPAATILILDDQVNGHLFLEAGDVVVTEVVSQVMNLRGHHGTGGGGVCRSQG